MLDSREREKGSPDHSAFALSASSRQAHPPPRAQETMMFGFDVNKLKPNLKMAVHRIGIVKNKKKNTTVAARREIANLLGDGKEEKARIRVEGIIRDDFTIEGYEIIELLCELVAERANLVKTERECPYDMREAVCTLIWAANRTEIPELTEVKKQLTKKYGQDFAAAAVRNVDGCVNERVMQKLSVQPPSAYLVVNYMKEIAKQFKVDWEPDESAIADPLAPIPAPTGLTVANAGVSGPDFAALYAAAPPPGKIPSALPSLPTVAPSDAYGSTLPPPPSSYAPAPSAPPPPAQQPYQPRSPPQAPAYTAPHQAPPPGAQQPSPAAASSNNSGDGIPDFDELTARFERLRKRQDQGSATSFTF